MNKLNIQVTVDQVMNLKPCYKRQWVEDRFAGRDSMYLTDILDLNISIDDKIWAVTKFLTDETNRIFARWCALQVVHLWDCPDITRQYLETGDEGIRAAANDAAGDAASAAAWAAASAAANDVAWAAAGAAAWDAARTAAGAAAWDVEWDAAEVAAGDAQVEKLKEMLREQNEKVT